MAMLAIDVGGSGSRALYRASGDPSAEVRADGPGLTRETHGGGLDAVLDALATTLPRPVGQLSCVAIGLAGLLTYESPTQVRELITARWPAAQVIVASDVLSALIGAVGLGGGVVVAAGTGTTALGTDMRDTWVRVDGWGPLVGDDGSGAWIGRTGLNAALRGVDGRRGGSAALHHAAMSRWGEPAALIRELHSSPSAALLASFAPAVRDAAVAGDAVAVEILRQAGGHLADAAIAALAEGVPARVSLVGGVSHLGAELTDVFVEAVRSAHPDVAVTIGGSSPLDGAVLLAENAASVSPHAPYIHSFHTASTR